MDDLKLRLAKFFDEAVERWSSGTDFEGFEIQDVGVRLGLLQEVAFDSEIHTDNEGCGVEDGDPWFMPHPEVISLLRNPA